ncbi:ABC transporter thiamine pyrophosphate-binding lipoprotein p37/Cypl [Mycoplasmopsis alligatoris]|uniref:High affinity transport system protein p37 n=1 Tax=Mycoplasmopsis alligatoris A21JP2 TaxID=747682 RepID=D4XV20_9BACT|nr:DNA repair protein HhH-GPD [Mycoplasmopsis alligatoris]EFF41838.1 high affinity transport system protein p37 [Mycoplasmopsis alligatoris A21JP2]
MKKNIKFLTLSLSSLLPLGALVSCAKTTNETEKVDIKNDIAWDNEITLTYGWENTDKWDKESYIKLMEDNFNSLKNKDKNLKKYPNVKFKLEVNGDKNATLQNLKSDKTNTDLAILPYHSFSNDKIDESFPQFAGQTGTLMFKWSTIDPLVYNDGSINDPLRKMAKHENELQFSAPYGEFKNWKDTKETYGFDGSKYAVFYNLDRTTLYYRGSILIAGNEAQRNAITKAWEEKNWEEFSKYGIIYKKKTSGGKFKYQVSLIAKHFSNKFKNENEVVKWLEAPENSKFVLSGKDATIIGQEQGDKRTFNIAFDDEGAFNWTPKSWGANNYVPTNSDSVVRVLSVTNPAPYDAILARVGLAKEQVNLLSQALAMINPKENTLGIYTGYNYFGDNKSNNFSELLKLQKTTEGSLK